MHSYERGRNRGHGHNNMTPCASGQTGNLDPQSKKWLADLHRLWPIWKNNAEFYNTVQHHLVSCENPFLEVLLLVQHCSDFGHSKRGGLAYSVMDTFAFFLKDNQHLYSHNLKISVKKEAVMMLPNVGHTDFMKIVIDVYKLQTEVSLCRDSISAQLSQNKYKEACQLAQLLNLHTNYTINEFILPLLLQDKFSIAESFLDDSKTHQEQMLRFLDELIETGNSFDKVERIAFDLEVDNVRMDKLHLKSLKKLMTRLMKKYQLSESLCPNLIKRQQGGALKYMLHKRYIDSSIGEESWREMAHEAVKDNKDLQFELVREVDFYDPEAAIYWAVRYCLPLKDLPFRVQEALKNGRGARGTVDWQCPGACSSSNADLYHTLNLPSDSIIMVNSPKIFQEFVHHGFSGASIVGIDAEWKPSFGSKQPEMALMQFALSTKIYLMDIIELKKFVRPDQWQYLGRNFFFNDNIVKLGFGLKNDLKAIESALPDFGGGISLEKGTFLDLSNMWVRVQKEGLKLPYLPDEKRGTGEGLADLVYLCFGKPLNKENQFSNWEHRPLRESQKTYAALDAFCLLEIYHTLEKCCKQQNIPFQGICKNLVTKNRSGHHHNRHTHHFQPECSKSKAVREKPCPRQTSSQVVLNVHTEPKCPVDVFMVCDTMVQGLGKKLRQLGIDTKILQGGMDHSHCSRLAQRENRYILTRGIAYSQLQYDVPEGHIYQVRSNNIEEQIEEVLNFFNIIVSPSDIFSICQHCNGSHFFQLSNDAIYALGHPEQSMDSDTANARPQPGARSRGWQPRVMMKDQEIARRTSSGASVQYWCVPTAVLREHDIFYVCDQCGKIYWDGSHLDRFLKGKVGSSVVSGSH